jgi:hypothetical protein
MDDNTKKPSPIQLEPETPLTTFSRLRRMVELLEGAHPQDRSAMVAFIVAWHNPGKII